MFLLELIASSFLDLISKQGRRNDAVGAFLSSLKPTLSRSNVGKITLSDSSADQKCARKISKAVIFKESNTGDHKCVR